MSGQTWRTYGQSYLGVIAIDRKVQICGHLRKVHGTGDIEVAELMIVWVLGASLRRLHRSEICSPDQRSGREPLGQNGVHKSEQSENVVKKSPLCIESKL